MSSASRHSLEAATDLAADLQVYAALDSLVDELIEIGEADRYPSVKRRWMIDVLVRWRVLPRVFIWELDLKTRTYGALVRDSVMTVGELLQRGRSGVAAIPGIGKSAMADIDARLAVHGLKLRDSWRAP